MNKIILLILLLSPLAGRSQNYQCLQYSTTHYYLNSNHYLRGIVVDSVTTVGDTTVYYPFHSPRGPYDITGAMPVTLIDSGSWVGNKVIQKSDGTFLFDSYWSDSVIIKTQANPGDSWVFFQDTGSLYYKATITDIDTMTILTSVDSVKKIMITAINNSGIVTTDPLDSFTIILSKNNGFVQVFDLYTFPYHKPDSVYRPGLDYFLDRSTCNSNNITSAPGYGPNKNVSIFNLVNFINPSDQQLHNWNTGDIIETYHSFSNYPLTFPVSDPVSYYDYILDTVSNTVVSAHATTYTISGVFYRCGYYTDPCNLILNSGSYTFYDNVYPIVDSGFMPESSHPIPYYLFYYPDDTSYCRTSPEYVLIDGGFGGEATPYPTIYKLGIGQTYNTDIDVEDFIWEWDGLTYTNFSGASCGSPVLLGASDLNATNKIEIYPNPAFTEINVTATAEITQVVIMNMVGQAIYTLDCHSQAQTIDVSALPAGNYITKINGTNVMKFVKE